MTYRILYSKSARTDLQKIRSYIRSESTAEVASRFTVALIRRCEGLKVFPLQGTQRQGRLHGQRVIGFRRRVFIHFTVEVDSVLILGFTYAGLDWEADPKH